MKKLGLALITAAFLGACGGSDDAASTTTTTTTTTDTRTAASTASHRQCTVPVTTSTSALGSFFNHVVQNIEGAVTVCFTASGNSSSIDGSLRIEYEDDFGIRIYSTPANTVYAGSQKIQSASTDIDIVFNDGYGFIRVKGSAPTATGIFAGTISYYNFPSQQDAITQAAQEAANKCKNGVYTAAQCMGYNFPTTYWYNQSYVSPTQTLVDQAMAILNNTSKTTQLGTFSTELSGIVN
ncbi:MAG: hypothetical protein JST16_15170 [Bdellovibrionales bacterium]|nr:hypothetical protein [Bdellovibrionales bacterium]